MALFSEPSHCPCHAAQKEGFCVLFIAMADGTSNKFLGLWDR